MRAAWYEKQGPAREVLTVGEMPAPTPGPGEVRIQVAVSGVNPGDVNAREVLHTGEDLIDGVHALAPDGVDHIVEVAFGGNIATDVELLSLGGSIAAYATEVSVPAIPFWPLVFKNVRVFFLGSDDFPSEAKLAAVRELNAALEAGWSGFEIAERVPLADIARAHELVEHPARPGRVVVTL